MAEPTAPTHFDELYPGRFLKAGLFKGKPVTLKISQVLQEDLEGEKGVQKKAILCFAHTDKQLVLCKLNGLCVKAMFGAAVQAWVGKRVTLFGTAEIAPMRRGEECIRVWGSPDIASDMQTVVTLPKRKPITIPLRKVQ